MQSAILALRQFTAFLKERLEHAGDTFSIGEKNFKDLLRIEEGGDVDLARLLKLGEEDLRRLPLLRRPSDPARAPHDAPERRASGALNP